MSRVLKRPVGGWNAREWRKEVRAWLLAALLFLMAGATCLVIYKLFDFINMAVSP